MIQFKNKGTDLNRILNRRTSNCRETLKAIFNVVSRQEMQIKTALRFYFIPVRNAKIKTNDGSL